MQEIRWRQRFNNYNKALQTLDAAVALAQTRALSPLEQQGLIQGFEFTHELAWNVLLHGLLWKTSWNGFIPPSPTWRNALPP